MNSLAAEDINVKEDIRWDTSKKSGSSRTKVNVVVLATILTNTSQFLVQAIQDNTGMETQYSYSMHVKHLTLSGVPISCLQICKTRVSENTYRRL